MRKILFTLLLTVPFLTLLATPPEPPVGFRWVLQEEFSDEFNGTELNADKWWDYYQPGWEGRRPARFEPKAISLKGGNLEIKSGMLDKPKRGYTMYGGAVVSKKYAHFGYYECNVKASKIKMSTTFWMSNDKVPFTENDACKNDQYSQELDIQESIGGGDVHQKFRNGMNSNTHWRYIKCGERRETFISKGAGTTLNSEVSDEYHTYAAWWKNPTEVEFYADNEFFELVKPSKEVSKKPFDRPMHINMVTETYDWQPAPTAEELADDTKNTAYYNWIRSYKLVPINEAFNHPTEVADLYKNRIWIREVSENVFDSSSMKFTYAYSNNGNGSIQINVVEGNKNRTTVQSKSIKAYHGYGKAQMEIPLTFTPEEGKNYRVELLLQDADGNTLDEVRYDVSR